MTISKTHKGPLAGIRVLDFTRVVAGPYCTMMLGDFGAEIIKVEDPNGGDELRSLGPPFLGTESVFFLGVNRSKKSVTLDLKDAESKKVMRELILSVDVLIENFRPGVMKRLGLSYESLRRLNPRLIYCSISAFDERSRYGDRPGYDLLISGMSGLQSVSGEPGRTPLGSVAIRNFEESYLLPVAYLPMPNTTYSVPEKLGILIATEPVN